MKRKSEKTAEKILDSAVEVFSEKGFSATTTSEIAQKAQVAEGTIFRYYPKKKDLLTKAIYKFLDTFGEQIIINPLEKIFENNKDQPAEVILKAIIYDRIKLFEKYRGHFKILITEMQYHEELLDIFRSRIVVNALKFGQSVIDELQKRGEIKNVNAVVTFRSLIGSVVLMMIQRSELPQIESGLSLEEEIDQVIDLFMNGIRKHEVEGE